MIARHLVGCLALLAAAVFADSTELAAQSGGQAMVEEIFNAPGSNFGVSFFKTKEFAKRVDAASFNGVGVEIRAIYPSGAIYLSGASLESPSGDDEHGATLGVEWLPLKLGRFAGGAGAFGTVTQIDGPDGKQAWLTLGGGASGYVAVTKTFFLGVSYNRLKSDLNGSRSQLVARIMLVP